MVVGTVGAVGVVEAGSRRRQQSALGGESCQAGKAAHAGSRNRSYWRLRHD